MFKDVPVKFAETDTGTFANAERIGNIGSNIWERFIIYFDFTNNQMILEPNTNFDAPFRTDKLGLVLRYQHKRYWVGAIITHTPAAELGIQKNDELLRVNDFTASELPLDDIIKKFSEPEGTIYLLAFRTSSGEERQTEVALKNYYQHYDHDHSSVQSSAALIAQSCCKNGSP